MEAQNYIQFSAKITIHFELLAYYRHLFFFIFLMVTKIILFHYILERNNVQGGGEFCWQALVRKA